MLVSHRPMCTLGPIASVAAQQHSSKGAQHSTASGRPTTKAALTSFHGVRLADLQQLMGAHSKDASQSVAGRHGGVLG